MTDEAQQQINQDQSAAPEPGWEWMLLEVMGHRSHWGRARDEPIDGSASMPELNRSQKWVRAMSYAYAREISPCPERPVR